MADIVILSTAALIDLDDIYDFHSARNPRYASELNARLRSAARSLSIHPERGMEIGPRDRRLRRLIEDGHLIVYAITDEAIVVARVVHSARDIEAILSEES